MNEKKNFFKETIKPIIVLVVICLLSSGLLGITNAVTAPIIKENELAAALKDRQDLLPEATGFTEIHYDGDHRVKSIHADDNGSGYIIVVEAGGYGGTVTTTAAIASDGSVISIRVGADTETKGLGSKVALESFTDNFIGHSLNDPAVSIISGATYSSKAVIESVVLALEVFDAVKGVN